MVILKVPPRVAIALPVPDRAKASTRVGISAPHATGNGVDSRQRSSVAVGDSLAEDRNTQKAQ